MAEVFGQVPLAQVVERLAAQVGGFTDLGEHVVLLDPEGFERARPELHRRRRFVGSRRPRPFFVRFRWAGKLVELNVVCREDTPPRMVYLVRRADLRRRP